MKFYCDNCQAKYSIADEKVRGKVLKVRCKKCSFVITVREPRAPVAQRAAAGVPPATPAALPWYYALNGQTYGPYEQQALMCMFESGELSDACYIWNETFTEWLPARNVPSFVPALNRGAQIRPRHKTIGVSGELESIKLDQLDAAVLDDNDEEEEGVVPGQMADRIDKLRERLKHHSRTPDAVSLDVSSFEKPVVALTPKPAVTLTAKPVVALTPKPSISLGEKKPVSVNPLTARTTAEEQDSTTQMSVSEISDLLDLPEPDNLPEFDLESGEMLPTLEGSENLMESIFPTHAEEDPKPAFIGTTEPQDHVIDFSRLQKKEDDQITHDGMFAGSASAFAPTPHNLDKFQTSQSLLIQMSSIKKQGRSKRVMMIGALVLIFCVLGVVAVIASQNAEKNPDVSPNGGIYDDSPSELILKKYSNEELVLYEIPGEEVISDEQIEEEPDEEQPQQELKVVSKKAAVIARNDVRPSTQTAPNLRGIGDLIGKSGSRQDDALNSSTSKSNGSGRTLSTKAGDARSIDAKGGDPVAREKASIGSLDTSIRRSTGPKFRGVDSGKSDDAPRLGTPGTLSSHDAQKGFKKVSRSVQSCHTRQVSRGLPLDSPKVYITLEIKGDGSVSSLSIEPVSVRSSEFASCLESHRKGGRWPFAEFGGKPLKIRHTYVMQ